MSPDNPLLRALLAQPDDDTLRLAMADWLDEHDQPARAEFIRIQIELARGVDDRARRMALELRQRDLLIAHEKEWTSRIVELLDCKPGEWSAAVFHRGFIEYFHLPATVINRRGEQLSRLTPVRKLFLRPCNPEHIVTLCKRSWLRSVTDLYVHSARLSYKAVRALIDCPYLDSLRVLDVVAGDVSEDAVKEFQRRFGRHLVRRPHV
jgi:uncharacterized protein (TIGR02996 family)